MKLAFFSFFGGLRLRQPGRAHEDGQDHHVPLSDPARAILDEMRYGSQGELIFPNPEGRTFSENAMLAVLDRLGPSAR